MNQYMLISVGNRTLPTLEKELNDLATEGWSVVTAFNHKESAAIVMIRRIPVELETSIPVDMDIFSRAYLEMGVK